MTKLGAHPTPPPPDRPGWPKILPCPYCARPRRATHPGDRFCDYCRASAAEIDTGPEAKDWT